MTGIAAIPVLALANPISAVLATPNEAALEAVADDNRLAEFRALLEGMSPELRQHAVELLVEFAALAESYPNASRGLLVNIAKHELAMRDCENACPLADEQDQRYDPTDGERVWRHFLKNEKEAARLVLEHPMLTVDDQRAKADHISRYFDVMTQQHDIRMLLASMGATKSKKRPLG